MVMTVEPGFGGQAFMADVAKAKLLQAREYLSHKLHGGEVHVDGGINRETAELAGGLGVDILVVGSALWQKGRNMAREIRLIRALADEGYQYALNDGVPPIPRDQMVTFATLRRPQARKLREEVETAGIPVLLFRSREDPAEMDDEIRRWDLLCRHPPRPPRRSASRSAARVGEGRTTPDVDPGRRRSHLTCGPCSSASAAPPCASTTRRSHRSAPGLLILLGVGHADDDAVADALARRVTELRIFEDDEAGRTARSSTSAGPRSS